jgi:hypothetical protein
MVAVGRQPVFRKRRHDLLPHRVGPGCTLVRPQSAISIARLAAKPKVSRSNFPPTSFPNIHLSAILLLGGYATVGA